VAAPGWQTRAVPLLLIRHADAGSRSAWDGPDRARPLSAAGQAEAAALVGLLEGYGVKRMLSSPYARCIETLEPLGVALSVEIECDEALGEGHGYRATNLVRSLAGEDAALCSHGDVIPEVLLALAAEEGVDLGPHPRHPKASTWVLESSGRVFVAASYLPAPG